MLKDNFSINETRRIMQKRHPVVTVVLLFLLMQVPGIVIGLGFGLYFITTNNYNFDQQEFMAAITGESFMLVNLYATILITLIGLTFAYNFQKRNAASLGLKNPNRLTNYLKGMVVGLLMMVVVVLILRLFGLVDITNTISNVSPLMMIVFIIGWMFQGFEEELITRSIWMNYFAVNNSVIAGIIINSILFSIMHLANASFGVLPAINIFLIGILFSLMFYIFDDIFFPAAAHSFWNMAQGNIFGIQVSGMTNLETSLFQTSPTGPDLWTGGSFGIEGSLITTIVILFVIGVFVKMIRDRGFDDANDLSNPYSAHKMVYESDLK